MARVLHFRGTRRQLHALLARVGRESVKAGANPVLIRIGNAVLGFVHGAFMKKAAGGADEANLKWPILAASTLAYKKKRGFFTDILRERGPLGESLEPVVGLR